jgi:hypothetical protein
LQKLIFEKTQQHLDNYHEVLTNKSAHTTINRKKVSNMLLVSPVKISEESNELSDEEKDL